LAKFLKFENQKYFQKTYKKNLYVFGKIEKDFRENKFFKKCFLKNV